jgi:hypothetical protein
MAELSAVGRALLAGREYIKSRGYWLEADGTCAADVDAGLADQSERMKAFLAGVAFRDEPTAALDGGRVLVSREHLECLARLYDKHVNKVEGPDRVKWEGEWHEGPLATAYLRTVEEVSRAAKLMLGAALAQTQPQSGGTSGEGERDG